MCNKQKKLCVGWFIDSVKKIHHTVWILTNLNNVSLLIDQAVTIDLL